MRYRSVPYISVLDVERPGIGEMTRSGSILMVDTPATYLPPTKLERRKGPSSDAEPKRRSRRKTAATVALSMSAGFAVAAAIFTTALAVGGVVV